MPRRTDIQSGKAKKPDYAAVTLKEELYAAWLAIKEADDIYRKNFSVYDDWHALFNILARVQADLAADKITPRQAFRRAHEVLRPMIGRVGAMAVIQAASSPIYETELNTRRRKLSEQAKGHADLLKPIGITGAYGGFHETIKQYHARDEAMKFGARIHRRIIERRFEGGVSAAIGDIEGKDGNPRRSTLMPYWTEYRAHCWERGYADDRLPEILRNKSQMPDDLLLISHFGALKH